MTTAAIIEHFSKKFGNDVAQAIEEYVIQAKKFPSSIDAETPDLADSIGDAFANAMIQLAGIGPAAESSFIEAYIALCEKHGIVISYDSGLLAIETRKIKDGDQEALRTQVDYR